MQTVTSTAKSPITILMIAIGILGVAFFGALPFFLEGVHMLSRLFLGALGVFYLLWTINLVLVYSNKRIIASTDGVTYIDPFGRQAHYAWADVEIDSYSARGWVLVFKLAGKIVKLSGLFTNRSELVQLLAALGKY